MPLNPDRPLIIKACFTNSLSFHKFYPFLAMRIGARSSKLGVGAVGGFVF